MTSKTFVVDTSIFRSAGRAENPESSKSREILEDILKICHKVIFTPYISSEWERHRSRYSYSWLASMTAKKKVIRRRDEQVFNKDLRDKISFINLGSVIMDAIEKDIPFIEAAMATDNLVISKDDKIKNILCEIIDNIPILKQISWMNPIDLERDKIVDWLNDVDDMQKKKKLGTNI